MLFFCLFQYFEETEYQTESKRNKIFGNVIFLTERDPGDLDPTARDQRGGHEGGQRAPLWRAPLPRGPLGAPPTYSFLLYIHTYPQTIRTGAKTLISPPQLSVSTRSHLGACSGAPSERAVITEGSYIIIASPMKCE